eukprot:TRINITY_DN5011_c0_g1_i1.p2 TRINITY_DN5011_c0_g1~~TRINITY_DN5011_c0_g1_i1.p2  ORF type:complete len:119 (+),score=27.80 TRINITY_DN5011_c0_g1_i1:407-763(+)
MLLCMKERKPIKGNDKKMPSLTEEVAQEKSGEGGQEGGCEDGGVGGGARCRSVGGSGHLDGGHGDDSHQDNGEESELQRLHFFFLPSLLVSFFWGCFVLNLSFLFGREKKRTCRIEIK